MKKRLPFLLAAAVVAFIVWRVVQRDPADYAGTVEATEVDVPARVAAVISTVTVREGERVTTGQALVRLDAPDILLAADLAERDFRRAQTLRRNGSVPEETVDRLRTRRDDAVLRRDWLTAAAPIDGTVLRRWRETGEWTAPGTKLLTLADLRTVYAYVYVSAAQQARLTLNQSVHAVAEELGGAPLNGRIVFIRGEAEFTPKNVQTREERQRLVFGVKVEFDNADQRLKPGMTVRVTL
jgi:HlyD family secretion protein